MFYFSNIGFFKSQGFNPSQYNPLFWFDASYGVTESGGLVSGWTDKTGNGHDIYQTIGSRQPTYDANSIYLNDLPAVGFGNGNIYTALKNTTSNLGNEVVNVLTMVMAFKTTNVIQYPFIYTKHLERRFAIAFANNSIYVYSTPTNAYSVIWTYPLNEPDYTPFVLTYRYDSSQNGIQRTKIFINGVYITTWSASGGFGGINTVNTGFILGNRGDGDGLTLDGYVSEAIFTRNINLNQQSILENYYMDKYNIQ